MKLTRKCAGCGESIHKDEMVQYFSASGNSSVWYCRACLAERQERERFSNKVCEIFGLKSPGPVIWTQRKRIKEMYGYTDSVIIDCLDYIYNVQHRQKLSESLVLVTPRTVNYMKAWKETKKAEASSMAAAIANTEMKEYIVPIKENTKQKKEINLDDALLE